jgi:hypothetical protein
MVDQAPLTPEDLRADARNTLRLAEIASSDRLKAKLLHAANEFLNKAAELEAGVVTIAPPGSSKAETRD